MHHNLTSRGLQDSFRIALIGKLPDLSIFCVAIRRSRPQRVATHQQQSASIEVPPPVWGGDFGLDGLGKHAIETLDEGGWVFEWDAFKKKGLVEE